MSIQKTLGEYNGRVRLGFYVDEGRGRKYPIVVFPNRSVWAIDPVSNGLFKKMVRNELDELGASPDALETQILPPVV